jgi:hypothetical protein
MLSSLSTELDDRILDFLDHDALNAVSKVSKYYRAIAEPHLYRSLLFSDNQVKAIHALFLTLISCPDLATHIRLISVSHVNCGPNLIPDNETFYEKFCQKLPVIHHAMTVLLGTGAPMRLLVGWMGAIAGSQSIEGCLAFILCSTNNVTSITIEPPTDAEHSVLLFEVMSAICHQWTVGKPEPFHSLKLLRMENFRDVQPPLIPFPDTLSLIKTQHNSSPLGLSTLYIKEVRIYAGQFQGLVQ